MILRVIKLLISFMIMIFDSLKLGIYRLFGIKTKGTAVTIYYHCIDTELRSKFARQLDCILKHFKPVRADISEPLEHGVHHVAVTIDDGFVCVMGNGVPELVKRGIPFAIFVPSNCL